MSFGFDCCCDNNCPNCSKGICNDPGITCKKYVITVSGVNNGTGILPAPELGNCQGCGSVNGTWIIDPSPLVSTVRGRFDKIYAPYPSAPCFNNCGYFYVGLTMTLEFGLALCGLSPKNDPNGKYYMQGSFISACNTIENILGLYRYYFDSPIDCTKGNWILKLGGNVNGIWKFGDFNPQYAIRTNNIDQYPPSSLCDISASQMQVSPV